MLRRSCVPIAGLLALAQAACGDGRQEVGPIASSGATVSDTGDSGMTNGEGGDKFDLGDGMATTDGVAVDPEGRKGAWFTDSEGNIIAITEDPRD